MSMRRNIAGTDPWSGTHVTTSGARNLLRSGIGGFTLSMASVAVAMALAALGTLAQAAATDGIIVNDGSDANCIRVNETSTPGWSAYASAAGCGTGDKATQTGRALFYNPAGSVGSNSLTLGGELYVNSGNLGLGGGSSVGSGAMRIGSAATLGVSTSGGRSLAIGAGPTAAVASGLDSIAIGTGAAARQASAVAIGAGSNADASGALAIGDSASLGGASSRASDGISVGGGSSVGLDAKSGIAIGHMSSVAPDAVAAVAIGATSTATGDAAAAYGESAQAGGLAGVAIGSMATTTDDYATAIGRSANASKGGAIAMGSYAVSSGAQSIAIGSGREGGSLASDAVTATADGAIAIGGNVFAGARSAATDGIALGGESMVASGATSGIAIGRGSTATGAYALAQGDWAWADGADSLAIGHAAMTSGADSIALGALASATVENSVALGSNATTTAAVATPTGTVAGTTSTFVGGAPVGVISVGSAGSERQLQHVAAGQIGAASSDAVNGSQLFATNQAVTQLGTETDSLGAGTASALGGGSIYNAVTGTISTPSYTTYNADGTTATTNNVGSAIDAFNSKGMRYFHANSSAPDSRATGINSVAIGPNAVATNSGDIAIGNNARATGGSGPFSGYASLSIGQNATSNGLDAYALGNTAKAQADYTMALGNFAVAGVSGSNGRNATAVGNSAQATGTGSSALGNYVTATGVNAVAIGGGGVVGAFMGNGANAASEGAVAIGGNTARAASSEASNGIAIGGQSEVGPGSTSGIAIGRAAVVNGVYAIAQGDAAVAGSSGALAIGQAATATGSNAIAFGAHATATEANSVAIGPGATTGAAVALPAGIVAGVAVPYAGGAPVGVVSVGSAGGERQVQHVAAGQIDATSTDAINGSQLFATHQALTTLNAQVAEPITITGNDNAAGPAGVKLGEALAVRGGAVTAGPYSGANISTVTSPTGIEVQMAEAPVFSGRVTASGFDASGQKVTNVAAGTADSDAANVGQLRSVSDLASHAVQYDDASKTTVTLGGSGGTTVTNVAPGALTPTSTDAVNGAQLFSTNQQVATNTTGIATHATAIATLNAQVVEPITITGNDNAAGPAGLKLGEALAVRGGAVTAGPYSGANISTVTSPTGIEVQMAEAPVFSGRVTASGFDASGQKVTNVAAGTADSDAANVGQLRSVSDLASHAVQYDDASKTTVTLGGSGGTTVTNVAPGALTPASTDAVNGAQLFSTNQQVATNTTNISHNTTAINDLNSQLTHIGDGGGVKYFHANSTLPDSSALGAESVAIGPNALARGARSLAIGEGAVADDAYSLALGAGSVTTVGAQAGYTAFGLITPQTSIGEVSIGTTGGQRKLTGVAAGSADTDAVNVSQLRSVSNQQANAVQYDDASKSRITLGGVGGTAITNVAPGSVTATSSDAVNGAQLYGVQQAVASINNGGGIKYFHANSNRPDSRAIGHDAVAIGPTAVAVHDNSVALGAGASTSVGAQSTYSGAYMAPGSSRSVGSVSVGATGAERQVTSVADGSAATDAVNVRQLQAGVGDAISTANAYTDSRIATLGSGSGSDPMLVFNNTSSAPLPTAAGEEAMAAGAGAQASGKRSTALGGNAIASGEGVTAVGHGASATGSRSVAIGAGANDGGRSDVASVGAVGAERQVINVAPGTAGTDAVNVNQLNSAVGDMQSKLGALSRNAYSGIASSMAMRSAPYVPGRTSFSLGTASYRGYGAFALSVRRTSDNGRWSLQGGVSTSAGGTGAYAGFSGVF